MLEGHTLATGAVVIEVTVVAKGHVALAAVSLEDSFVIAGTNTDFSCSLLLGVWQRGLGGRRW